MVVGAIDWGIIILYNILAIGLGLFYTRRAGKNTGEFFLAGRSLPWWLAGASMAATTFAVDTPLAVVGLVSNEGLSGMMITWNGIIYFSLTTFVYSVYWRRADIITDIGLVEMRYSGIPAKILRGFRAIYFGLLLNCFMLGWVVLAMQKIVVVVFQIEEETGFSFLGFTVSWKVVITLACLIIAGIYSTLSGFIGVVKTDIFQFFIALTSAWILAGIAIAKAGGMGSIIDGLGEVRGDKLFSLLPSSVEGMWLFWAYIIFSFCNKSADGSGYYAQRMFACKDERHSMLATLWFCVLNFVVRPWAWILVGVACMVKYPGSQDPELNYPRMMMEYMPPGLLGCMLTGFLAAFMSTVDTHFNWGTSYLIVDVYQRFISKKASEKHLVFMGRVIILVIMTLTAILSLVLKSVVFAWKALMAAQGSIGLVFLLRWHWWRINAWSEITAMISSFIAAVFVFALPWTRDNFPLQLTVIVVFSTACWIVVTLLTPPTDPEILSEFYNKLQPIGFWGPVRSSKVEMKALRVECEPTPLSEDSPPLENSQTELVDSEDPETDQATLIIEPDEPDEPDDDGKTMRTVTIGRSVLNWGLGMAMLFGLTFGIGYLFFYPATLPQGLIFTFIGVLATSWISWRLNKGEY